MSLVKGPGKTLENYQIVRWTNSCNGVVNYAVFATWRIHCSKVSFHWYYRNSRAENSEMNYIICCLKLHHKKLGSFFVASGLEANNSLMYMAHFWVWYYSIICSFLNPYQGCRVQTGTAKGMVWGSTIFFNEWFCQSWHFWFIQSWHFYMTLINLFIIY